MASFAKPNAKPAASVPVSNVGEIDHLMIDKPSGKVADAVMSFGGLLGLGHSHYPLPWGVLTYDKDLGGFRSQVTEALLKDAPALSDDLWTDLSWQTQVHEHDGQPTYWSR